jgi:cellulose biosynthesis protein BcsQ
VQAIDKVKRYLNPALNLLGCVIVKFDRYNATHQKFEKLIRQFAKANNFSIFKTNIPNSQSVAAAAAHGLPLFHYKGDSPASLAYQALSKEIDQATRLKINIKPKKKSINMDLEIAADL